MPNKFYLKGEYPRNISLTKCSVSRKIDDPDVTHSNDTISKNVSEDCWQADIDFVIVVCI